MTSTTLHSLADTEALAAQISAQLHAGDVVALEGTLGVGKTAFARALIQHRAGQDMEVVSPTFTLLQTYPMPDGSEVWHYDLYRIEHPSALMELALDEALAHLTLIEWPERLGDYPLPITHRLNLTLEADGTRRARFTKVAA